MIRNALPYLFDIPVVYMTDSALVSQILEEQCLFSCRPHDIHELLHLWKQLCTRATKQHVKGHSGHPLNTITDKAAQAALLFQHHRTLYGTACFSKVFLTSPHQNMPDFHSWLG